MKNIFFIHSNKYHVIFIKTLSNMLSSLSSLSLSSSSTSQLTSSSNKYVLIDYSGSTGGHVGYWDNVLRIIKENPDATFVLWDTFARVVSFAEAEKNAKNRSGNGGTQPQCFAKLLPTKAHVIIITDGQVGSSDVQQCDAILNGREFSHVDVHFYNTGGNMNLSVSAPFTRKTEYRIFVSEKVFTDGSSTKVIDLSPYENNPDKFIAEAEDLLKQIIMQNVGKTNNGLRNDLLELQKNLMKYIATNNSQGGKFDQIRELLVDSKYNESVELMKSIILNADNTLGKRVETIIQELINQCSGSSNFSFAILEPGRLSRATPVVSVATEELPSVENYSGEFECPVSLDFDIPVCLVKQGPPVFENIEKNYLENLMTNPLLLLNSSELVEKLKNRIDHLVGLEGAKELFLRGNVKSPMTRDPISCALVFGIDNTHIKATDYTLANLLFGTKLVGQSELWLAVLYFVINQIPYLADNKPFMESFQSHMMHRMRTRTSNITLSGLPIEPLMKCPVDIAIWYCVTSPFIVNNTSNTDDARNRLRSFGATSKYLVELVEMFGYPYDKSWTLHQMSLYKAFAWMMREEKDNSPWRTLLCAQYQNSLVLENGTIILLDGPSSEKNKPELPSFKATPEALDISVGELVKLSELVDRGKTINSVMIPMDLGDCPVPNWKKNYGYADDAQEEQPGAINISPQTYRPYVIDRKLYKHWKTCCEARDGPLNKQISNYNYFIKFVHEFHKYPTKQEFYNYLSNKQSGRLDGAMDTLPKLIVSYVDSLFKNYEVVLGIEFTNVDPHEFKKVTCASMPENVRKQMDGSENL